MIDPSDDFVRHIQELSINRTGKELSYEEAQEGACNLIGFYDLLLKIDRRNKNAKLGESQNYIE
jgi:hypothetical protein